MTDPPEHEHGSTAFGGPDPTRDIKLPPLPGRPPSVLPPEWTQAPPSPRPDAPTPDLPGPPPGTSVREVRPAPARPRATPLVDEPTDELAPPRDRPRERTIAFASPAMAAGRPMPVIGPTSRHRRWPWVLLTLLPVLVIAGAGIALLVLLAG